MCFDLLENLPFLEKKTVAVSSQYILKGIAIKSTTPSPEIKFLNHKAWLKASKQATNSASIVDEAVIDYFSLFHDIAPFASIKTNPEVDFKLSRQPP